MNEEIEKDPEATSSMTAETENAAVTGAAMAAVNENLADATSPLAEEEKIEEPQYRNWRIETDAKGVAWLYADKAEASTNVLSRQVLEELGSILERLQSRPPRGLVIRSAKANGFIAGADVKEFSVLTEFNAAQDLIQHGQSILDQLEALPFPTVALIHGFCLGGGLELALACRYRIADDGARTKLGLPEVMLGIHPGFGGTMRLTRLLGAPAAMDLMLTGRSVDARKAQRMGLIDYAVPTRQLEHAAEMMISEQPSAHKPGFLMRMTNSLVARLVLANEMHKKVALKAKPEQYPAPYALIDLWAKHGGSRRKMLREEARSVARLMTGDTARNLLRVFFLQERLKSLGPKTEVKPRHVHVIGGGVMGGDIASWCALRGMTVSLQDRKHATLAKVMKRSHDLYAKILKHPRLVQEVMDRLMPDKDGQGLSRADVVIEAIFEDVDAKQNLYRQIEPIIKPDALLATNTSSIPLETLASVLSRPERLVGVHFFNPVSKMQLVEIVSSPLTDPQIAERAAAFVRQIDRLPLPVKSTPGFLVNRVLMPYLLEAVILESEGVPAPVIDKAATDFGMPMGPITLADTVGLDICLHVAEILSQSMNVKVPLRLRDLVHAGHLGLKSGQGFYKYENGSAVKDENAEYAAPARDLTDRLILRMLNEATACLREGVVTDADLLDAGMIFGTGFAPFRGGPMQCIKQTGAAKMRQTLLELKAVHGDRFHPDPGWDQ